MRKPLRQGRHVRWVAVVLACVLLAAACGDDDTSDETTAAPDDATSDETTAAPDDATSDETTADAAESDRPFEGVTLQFAKAPFSEDEKQLFEEWLQPFIDRTGINIEHTIVPWDSLEAIYSANFAGGDPFDVMYQTSTQLTLFGDRGAFEDLDQRFNAADYVEDRSHYPDGIVNGSYFQGHLYGIPSDIGTIIMFANMDLLAAAGIDTIPQTTDELIATAQAVQDPPNIWGFYTSTTVADFGWYFNLQNVHNFGGDIISDDFTSVTIDSEPVRKATEYAVDLICGAKVQPPLGQYDREGAVELFKAGKLAFLLDEPLRVQVFQDEGLPFEWEIAQPVGAPDGTQTQFSTTGFWVMSSESENPDAAWELVKYLSSAELSSTIMGHFGFIPARDDVDVTGGNELLEQNFEWAMTTWDGLRTHPKISQILDEYVQALEAATTCDTPVDEALATAQDRATDVLSQE